MSVSFELKMKTALAKMKKLQEQMEPAKHKTVMKVLSERLNNFIMDNFKQEQGPDGKWKGLKIRQGKILQDTGRLKNSIKPDSDNYNGWVATNLDYAGIHNFGGKAGRGGKVKIPKRKFMGVTKNQKQVIRDSYLTLLNWKF